VVGKSPGAMPGKAGWKGAWPSMADSTEYGLDRLEAGGEFFCSDDTDGMTGGNEETVTGGLGRFVTAVVSLSSCSAIDFSTEVGGGGRMPPKNGKPDVFKNGFAVANGSRLYMSATEIGGCSDDDTSCSSLRRVFPIDRSSPVFSSASLSSSPAPLSSSL